MLAAEEDAGQVDVLDPPPGLERGLERREVVRRRDPRVVEEPVDPPALLAHARVERAHLVLIGDVGGDRRIAGRVLAQVNPRDRRALGLEQPHRLGADPSGGARDHAHLAVEPTHQVVA
jgi:hypothetical protein